MKTSTSITFEARGFKRLHTGFAAVGDGDVEALALQTDLDGPANQRVVVDHQNARHDEPPSS